MASVEILKPDANYVVITPTYVYLDIERALVEVLSMVILLRRVLQRERTQIKDLLRYEKIFI